MALSPLPPCGKATEGHIIKVETVLDRPLAPCRGSGAALATWLRPNRSERQHTSLKTRNLTMHQTTIRSHEGTTRPAEAWRKALRPQRSQTTPPRPRGLHPAGALARTHRNKVWPRKAGPLAKKVRQSLQESTNTPFEARGLLSGTVIRGTPNTPKHGW
jgi:hypothetical protein